MRKTDTAQELEEETEEDREIGRQRSREAERERDIEIWRRREAEKRHRRRDATKFNIGKNTYCCQVPNRLLANVSCIRRCKTFCFCNDCRINARYFQPSDDHIKFNVIIITARQPRCFWSQLYIAAKQSGTSEVLLL